MRYEHGLKKHPLYSRWNSIVCRCYNESDRSYKTYGARGIKIEHIWDRRNPEGVKNFIEWIEAEVVKEIAKNPLFLSKPYVVARLDTDKNFSPDNCHLTTMCVATQNRSTSHLTFDKVVKLRQHKKKNPKASITGIALMFGETLVTTFRAIYGLTWANVDVKEPPLKRTLRPRKNKDEGTESMRESTA